jgi:hypothetical protein
MTALYSLSLASSEDFSSEGLRGEPLDPHTPRPIVLLQPVEFELEGCDLVVLGWYHLLEGRILDEQGVRLVLIAVNHITFNNVL